MSPSFVCAQLPDEPGALSLSLSLTLLLQTVRIFSATSRFNFTVATPHTLFARSTRRERDGFRDVAPICKSASRYGTSLRPCSIAEANLWNNWLSPYHRCSRRASRLARLVTPIPHCLKRRRGSVAGVPRAASRTGMPSSRSASPRFEHRRGEGHTSAPSTNNDGSSKTRRRGITRAQNADSEVVIKRKGRNNWGGGSPITGGD